MIRPTAPAARTLRPKFLPLATSLAILVVSAVSAGDWPGWRGAKRDAHLEGENLPAQLTGTPAVLWRIPIGHGYAAPVVAGGKLIFVDDTGSHETAHCLDAATGRELWAQPYHDRYADEFEPGPRCTPQIDGDRVYVQSCLGEFRCLSLADGATRWRFHFADHGAFWISERNSPIGAANRRGHSGSPVIVGDRIFIQVGGTNGASIVACDKQTGRVLWKSQNDLTCYSSLASGQVAGRSQVVAATCEGLLGLATDDGRALWRVPFKTGANRNVLTPLIDGDTVIFSSHTTGLRRTRIQPDGERCSAQDEWLNRELKINLSTPVLVGEYLYGLGPDTAKALYCVERKTGQVKWSEPGFGLVAALLTDGRRLLVLRDSGEVRLLTADPERYQELGRFQACGKTYAFPAVANGRLYVRDSRELVAYELK